MGIQSLINEYMFYILLVLILVLLWVVLYYIGRSVVMKESNLVINYDGDVFYADFPVNECGGIRVEGNSVSEVEKQLQELRSDGR